jgi:ACT domain-containing protein
LRDPTRSVGIFPPPRPRLKTLLTIPSIPEVEKKLKKLDWGGADVVDPREHLNIVFIGHVGTHFIQDTIFSFKPT